MHIRTCCSAWSHMIYHSVIFKRGNNVSYFCIVVTKNWSKGITARTPRFVRGINIWTFFILLSRELFFFYLTAKIERFFLEKISIFFFHPYANSWHFFPCFSITHFLQFDRANLSEFSERKKRFVLRKRMAVYIWSRRIASTLFNDENPLLFYHDANFSFPFLFRSKSSKLCQSGRHFASILMDDE